ncbi:MAG TPA: hypothetical protein VFU61_03135, partial [Steroidobacteraceae bacterium]|nr:hypothetical protein [Steroidobacteraceae bacterium]
MKTTLLRAIAGIVAAIAVSGVAVGAQTTPTPSGEKLRQEILAALGGEARLQGFKSYRASGTMVGLSGFPGTAQILARAPGDRLLTWDIRYLKQSAGVEAAHAWLQAGTVRELAGREADRARRDARFEPLYHLLEARVPFAVTSGSCVGTPVYLLE